jgi:hypothetical protein
LWDYDFHQSESIYIALNNLDSKNTYLDKNYVSYAIKLIPGMDRNEVIEYIVLKTKEILKHVGVSG